VYPKGHQQLAEEIVGSGGALISEQPFGVKPYPHNLLNRDRIQSGLSLATIVMQTDVKGGTMHTARCALLQNRLLCVPVPRGSEREERMCKGLIALGEKTGSKLCTELGATGAYASLLNSKYRGKSVAFQIHITESIDGLAKKIEERYKRYGCGTAGLTQEDLF